VGSQTSTRRNDPLITIDEDIDFARIGFVYLFKLEVEAWTTGPCQEPGSKLATGITVVTFRLVSLLKKQDPYDQTEQDEDGTHEIRQKKREALEDRVGSE